jgi:DNA-binding MarR family transcriptional regulator
MRKNSDLRGTVEERVNAIRVFNRFWVEQVAILQAGLFQLPYSVTEVRVIFELAQRDATQVVDLRRDLELTGGYMSRVLARLKSGELITTEKSETHCRRQVVRLTSKGWLAVQNLDQQSAQPIRALLAQMPEDRQRRLIGAMSSIRQILDRGSNLHRSGSKGLPSQAPRQASTTCRPTKPVPSNRAPAAVSR